MIYEVITVTNNPTKYPRFAEASRKHPSLVDYVQDECDTFVQEADVPFGAFWCADEFFECTDVKRFEVLP